MLNYNQICREMYENINKMNACTRACGILESAGYYHKDVWYALNDESLELEISIELLFEIIHSDMVLRHMLTDESEKFQWTIETDVASWTLKNEYSIEFIGAVAEIFNGEPDFSADYDYTSSKWISIETR